MGRKRKAPKPRQLQHPARPASGTRQRRRTLSLKCLLPEDPAWEWPLVSVKRPSGGGISKVLDLKRCHEFRLKFAFYAANQYIQRLEGHNNTIHKTKRRFDDELTELITEAGMLHCDKREEKFSLLQTEPLVFWARVQERLRERESNSFILHGLITPHTLIEFIQLTLASWKGYDGLTSTKGCTSSSALAMNMIAVFLIRSELSNYDGPGPKVVYGEREKRVLTADGCDIDLVKPGTDTTGDGHMMEQEHGTKVFDSEVFVAVGWDDEDHGDHENHHEPTDMYNGPEVSSDYQSSLEDGLTDMVEDLKLEEMQVDVDQAGDGVVVPEGHGIDQFDLSKLSEALPQ